MTVPIGTSVSRRRRPYMLDIAAEVLVADPAASLNTVALAAGIGRTTLHSRYKTRDDLLRAVAYRVLSLWQEAVEDVPADGPDGGLRALIEALIPIGPQLAFLWRTPSFDRDTDLLARWAEVEQQGRAVLIRARGLGVLRPGPADWWLLQTLYSLVYVASESIRTGQLAPRDAPDLVLDTLLHGLGQPGDRS
jgi:AcrR family transcriptional regulator